MWKDSAGKTKVHLIACPFLGVKGKCDCFCPTRLAVGTVSNLVQGLADIFQQVGRGTTWYQGLNSGNPARSPLIKGYYRQIAAEQAQAHVLPKQAKPIFLDKVRKICIYVDNQLKRTDLKLAQMYVLYRDQAFLKLQYFAGDRATDLTFVPTQEVKRLVDDSGFRFSHTYTKTIRGGKGMTNTFDVKRCADKVVCPVEGLERYISWCKRLGVDLSNGYLFRIVDESDRVLCQRVTYSVMYNRLQQYLVTLGIYGGETPHSFRAGCAITLGMSGAIDDVDQMMQHVGWFTPESAHYYSRVKYLGDTCTSLVAKRFAESVKHSDDIRERYEGLEEGVQNAF